MSRTQATTPTADNHTHSTKTWVSVALALIRAIERSTIHFGKHIHATSFGTILLMIILFVMPEYAWTILSGYMGL
jgi:hypothetical protein